MEAYCVRCKTKHEIKNPIATFTAQGTRCHTRRMPGLWHYLVPHGGVRQLTQGYSHRL
jgi:hypothetical protein